MMSEILKMQDFSHPHVMTLIGMSFDAANTPSMVMPYMANGSLLSYLKMNRPLLLIVDVASDVDKVRGLMCVQCAQNANILLTIHSATCLSEAADNDLLPGGPGDGVPCSTEVCAQRSGS